MRDLSLVMHEVKLDDAQEIAHAIVDVDSLDLAVEKMQAWMELDGLRNVHMIRPRGVSSKLLTEYLRSSFHDLVCPLLAKHLSIFFRCCHYALSFPLAFEILSISALVNVPSLYFLAVARSSDILNLLFLDPATYFFGTLVPGTFGTGLNLLAISIASPKRTTPYC